MVFFPPRRFDAPKKKKDFSHTGVNLNEKPFEGRC